MGKYLNKKNKFMNLNVTRFQTIHVFPGIHSYPDEIATKFPDIFEPAEPAESKEIEEIEEPAEIEEIKDNTIEGVKEEMTQNYSELSFQDLAQLAQVRNIEIEGRSSIKKYIEALEKQDKETSLIAD